MQSTSNVQGVPELRNQRERVLPGVGSPPAAIISPSPGDFDEGAVLERVGGNVPLLQDLVAVFRADCARLLPSLRAALEHNDPANVRLTAHTLKGMVSFFAAKTATETAHSLENSGAAGDLTTGPQQFATLVHEIERLQASLQRMQDEG